MSPARGSRLVFDGLERQDAGIDAPLANFRVAGLGQIFGLLELPERHRRAVRPQEQRHPAKRRAEHALAGLAVQPRHRPHARRHAILVGEREEIVPEIFDEPGH